MTTYAVIGTPTYTLIVTPHVSEYDSPEYKAANAPRVHAGLTRADVLTEMNQYGLNGQQRWAVLSGYTVTIGGWTWKAVTNDEGEDTR